MPSNAEFTSAFFTNASNEWMANKIRRDQMTYYRCETMQKNGVQCSLPATMGTRCRRHEKSFARSSLG